jgi:uncharacterized membrane protein YozB (DUF420 family)
MILVALITGFLTARFKHRFMIHGGAMAIAVILNMVSVVVIMVPSFLAMENGLLEFWYLRFSFTTILHAILGSLAETLGIYLVGRWAFYHQDAKACFRKRKIMIVTISLWLLDLTIGFYIYAMAYLSI